MDAAVRPATGVNWRRIGFLTLGIVAALAYVTGDTLVRSVAVSAWNVLALAAVGFRAAHKDKGDPWRKMFVAFAVYTTFNCVFFLVPGLTGTPLPFPSIADLGLFASYILYGITLVHLGKKRTAATRDTLDVLIVTAALSVPLWEFVVRGSISTGMPVQGTLTTLTYPAMLTVLLALALRVVFIGSLPLGSGLLLLGWIGGEFAGNVYIGISSTAGSYEGLSRWYLFMFGSYACLGALALTHPAEAKAVPEADVSGGYRRAGRYGRAALLGGSLLVPLLSLAVIGTERRAFYALIMTAALVVAIVVRLSSVTVSLDNQRELLAEMKLLSTDLAHQALHDSLTGLPNRVLLADRIDNALAQPLTRANRGVAMLMLDLDRFKTVNDTYGHQAGDQVLVAVAACLREACRDDDTLARFSGDEFALVLPDADLAEALRAADRISHSLLSPISVGEMTFVPSASIGIVVAEGQDRTALIRHADIAMYAAKAKGIGATAVFHSELHAQVIARHQMEIDLRGAAARGELVLEYQPVLNLADHEMVAVEALVRWQHPVRGWLPPLDFIPLAEECGAIAEIGDWVLQRACEQAILWDSRHPASRRMDVAVNVSPLQLIDGRIIDRFSAILAAVAIDPSRVILEITESAFGAEPEQMISRLEELRSLGVQLAIDDFGTGYSSLSLLRRLPADIIKIDKSFVDDIACDPQGWALAAAIVKLATSLGRRTHAEGVEYGEQLAHLRALNCELGQGYLFDRPLSADTISERIHSTELELRGDAALTRG